MTLLAFDRATKRFTSGQRERVALEDVSLALAAGECVAVYGLRRSGRTTLLRLAAGILRPDAGEVRFDGRPPSARGLLGVEIAWCTPQFDPAHGGSLVDHVAVALLARGAGRARARARAEAALERAGASGFAAADPHELRAGELIRAGIARALVTGPRLLLLDEPTAGAEVGEREAILALVRSLAAEGAAILMTVGEPVAGADRVLTLDGGRLRGDALPAQAPVLPLRPQHAEPVA